MVKGALPRRLVSRPYHKLKYRVHVAIDGIYSTRQVPTFLASLQKRLPRPFIFALTGGHRQGLLLGFCLGLRK